MAKTLNDHYLIINGMLQYNNIDQRHNTSAHISLKVLFREKHQFIYYVCPPPIHSLFMGDREYQYLKSEENNGCHIC